jgi:long-chain acyl-CoA synthetase
VPLSIDGRPNLLLERFCERCRTRPDVPIVVSPARRTSPAEMAAAAEAWRSGFAARGLVAGDIAAIAARGATFLAAWLGALARGLAPILIDAATPLEEVRRIASTLGARALVAHGAALADLGAFDAAVVEGLGTEGGPTLDGASAIKLTSGSTGAPRGIVVSDRALLADDEQLTAAMDLWSAHRFLAAIPLSHSYGLSSLAVPALTREVSLVVPDDPGPFQPLIAAERLGAEFLPTVPAWLGAMNRVSDTPAWPATVRRVISAGAPLAPDVATTFRRRYGLPAHVFYGSSETGGISYDTVGDAAERGTVGTAIPGVEIEIDAETARVAVRSPAVASGYWPDADARLAEGRFLTSDLGRLDGGELRLLGRVDDWILVRGKNVNPREVEDVLRAFPGIDDVAVFGSSAADNPEPVVRAVVATRSATPPRADALLAWCRTRLAEYKVPRGVAVVAELPRTERGKLDRGALRSLR